MRSTHYCSLLVLAWLFQATAYAQGLSSELRNGAPCYSCGLKAGGQSLPLLSLPASLERREQLLNRSIGGIAGSSFQTEQATPEQTFRQALKAPPEPVFTAAPTAVVETESPLFAQSRFLAADRFSFQRSFEQRFGTETDESTEAFRLVVPDLRSPFKLLGGKHKRGALSDLFAQDLNF